MNDSRETLAAAHHARAHRIFVAVTMLSCLVLQRVGVPAGSSAPISMSAPIVALMAFWYVWTGVLSFDRNRVGIMLGLAGVALIGLNLQRNMPLAMVTRISMTSLVYWLAITAFATLRFVRPMDERTFFIIMVRCLAFVAGCGVIAFLAQFVGIQLFTFKGILPDQFSMEGLFNGVIPLNGKIIKANGFFLVEPSAFSQFMALGLICEWMEQRRPAFIALFLLAIFCSSSGTGWLMVGSFVAYVGLTRGGRGFAIALVFCCVCAIGFVAISFVFPAITDSLSSRIGEINEQGSSGNARFVTPLLVAHQVLSAAPWAFFTGIGPGAVDSLAGITYTYNMNTPIKIILEYGIFALLLYLVLILWNARTARQNAVLLPALVLLLIAGGNEHFPPVLFPVLLLATVANLQRGAEAIRDPGFAGLKLRTSAHA